MASIDLHVLSVVGEEKLQAFVTLLKDFLPDAAIPHEDHLRAIYVVADESKEALCNELIHLGKEQGTYVTGPQSRAHAIPVELDNELACFLVFGTSLIQQIDPQNPNAAEIVAVLLEELFHVRHYSTLWQQQGYVFPRIESGYPEGILKMCFNFYDEYVTNRWKFHYLSQKLNEFRFSDSWLIATLDQAQSELFSTVYDAASGKMSAQDAWLDIMQCMYRKVFELLARYAAPLDTIPNELLKSAPVDLTKSHFYRTHLVSFWPRIHDALKNAYESDLRTSKTSLNTIVQIMTELFASLGIIYHKTAEESWWVDFVVKQTNEGIR